MFRVVNEYGTKVIQSGKVIEVYEYKNPVKNGYTGGKGGRKKVATSQQIKRKKK